jgi:DNA-binding IscR family transcriptional regulator
MPRSSRFSVALHLLVHLVDAPEPQTSEQLAACVGTNAVVVRRTLAGLREAGLVTSTRGTGGGWRLARAAGDVTLRDVYAALGERLLGAVDVAGPGAPAGGCRIQRAVAGTLDEFLEDAEALLAARLGRITLAVLAARVGDIAPHHHASSTPGPHADEHHRT